MSVSQLAGPVTCVRLSGRLDAQGADQIGLRFTAESASAGAPAIVDLSQVDFIASLGIRLLISTARALSAKGHRLVLFGAPEMVRNVLDDAAIDQIMAVVDTEAQALEQLA